MAGIEPETEHSDRREVLGEGAGRGAMRHERDEKQTAKVVAGGSITEAIAGLAAAALAILGLTGILPGYFAAIATIAVGVALLAQGGAVAASGTQMLIGITTIVLGILALIGIDPLTLSLVGLLAAGASILFSGSAVSSRMLGILRR